MTCRTEDLPNSHVSRTAPEVQQESSWTAPAGTLGELIGLAQASVAALVPRRLELEVEAGARPPGPSLVAALKGETVAVIAEIKRRSPSKGALDSSLSAGDRAVSYVSGGAAAISVLTENTRFGGSLADLAEVVRVVCPAPVLRKDFIVHELQVLEAKAAGASAILLIARALPPELLAALVGFARAHEIEPFVETRDRDEIARAVEAGAIVIGINARNLETLEIDAGLVPRLLEHVPAELLAVAESGIEDRAAVERLASAGADAVLVGSVLSLASDGERAVRDLAGVERRARSA